MLIKESEYLKELICALPKENLKILNFGSQSSKYLKKQPYIYENIINTVIKEGHTITNLDLQDVDGVDLVGDIFNDDFFLKLKEMNFDVIFVFNILEHVTKLELMISRLQELVKSGKYILFSGPYKYPFHMDPIDNMFRPDVNEVSNLFNKCVKISGKQLLDYPYSKYLFKSSFVFIKEVFRIVAFFYKFEKWKKVVLPKLKWIFTRFEVTCVLFKKL